MKYLRENNISIRGKHLVADSDQEDKLDPLDVSSDEIKEEEASEAYTDTEFDLELQKFKERLETITKDSKLRFKEKLVPNISKVWLSHLKQLLLSQPTGYKSPRSSNLINALNDQA